MKKYILKIFYFSLLLLFCCLFIFLIDPHNFFNISKLIKDDAKIKVINRSYEATTRGNMLWKALKYRRKPCENIIIGDSQGFDIREKLVSELTGEEYFNFCIPGASLQTKFSIFWFVAKQIKLKKVYLEVSFINSDAHRSYNLFHFAQDYFNKPYLYFSNKEIIIDSYYNLMYALTADRSWAQNPLGLESIKFMNQVSELKFKLFFGNYSYPEKSFVELRKISDYCINHDIELNFIIFPNYRRVDEYLSENGLINLREKYGTDIGAISKLYDFSNDTRISAYRNNFKDYYHINQHMSDSLTVEIWKRR